MERWPASRSYARHCRRRFRTSMRNTESSPCSSSGSARSSAASRPTHIGFFEGSTMSLLDLKIAIKALAAESRVIRREQRKVVDQATELRFRQQMSAGGL